MTPTQVLKQYFGYESFRPGQTEIIQSVLAGYDTLALLATGGGKSLCFQVPGLVLGGTTLVISPLISLMKDQVDALLKRGIQATFINSALSPREQATRLAKFQAGDYDFVYLSPEKLLTQNIRQVARLVKIKLLVIDEAHCISEWGHDFRPEYRQIATFMTALPHRPVIMALTATATQLVRQDICQVLQLQKTKIFVNTFRRPNLAFLVINCATQTQQIQMLLQLLHQHHGEAGIIYAATREMTETLAHVIQTFDFHQQFSVQAYHGGLNNQQRSKIQEDFLHNTVKIITATNAFGMGVDKGNVRFVIHYQFPASLEHYYQEAGRAGRDQAPAKCYVLFNPVTTNIHLTFIKETPNQLRQKVNLAKLHSVLKYLRTRHCRTQALLTYFDEVGVFSNCQACDVCLNSSWSLTTQQQRYAQKLRAWSESLCQEFKLQPWQLFPPHTVKYLTLLQPLTHQQLAQIPGLGTGWQRRWGKQFAETFFTAGKKYLNN